MKKYLYIKKEEKNFNENNINNYGFDEGKVLFGVESCQSLLDYIEFILNFLRNK